MKEYKCPYCFIEFKNWLDLKYHLYHREGKDIKTESEFKNKYTKNGFGILIE